MVYARGGSPLIEGVRGVSNALPVAPAARISVPQRPSALARGVDDASSLTPGSSLRVRLASPNARTDHLQRVARFVDSAHDALGRAQDSLALGRERLSNGELHLDDLLDAIDREVMRPTFGNSPALKEGVTLAAGTGELDIRPVSTEDLGAIVDHGRSHRLANVRSGQSLDPAGSLGAAQRSLTAAQGEVAGLRSRLDDFRTSSLVPAQRGVLAEVAAAVDTGPASFATVEALAGAVRASMGSSGALVGTSAANVLALLT